LAYKILNNVSKRKLQDEELSLNKNGEEEAESLINDEEN